MPSQEYEQGLRRNTWEKERERKPCYRNYAFFWNKTVAAESLSGVASFELWLHLVVFNLFLPLFLLLHRQVEEIFSLFWGTKNYYLCNSKVGPNTEGAFVKMKDVSIMWLRKTDTSVASNSNYSFKL